MHPYSLFTTANLVICFHRLPSQRWFRSVLAAIRTFYRVVSVDELEEFFYDGKAFNSRCLLRFDDGDRSFYEYAFPVLKDLAVPAIVFVSPQVLRSRSNYWFQDMAQLQRLLPEATIMKKISAVTGRPVDEIQKFGISSLCKSLPIKEIQRILEGLEQHTEAGFERSLNISAGQLQEICRSGTITVGAHTLNHAILTNEDDYVATAEIERSVSELSRMLNRDVLHFAYPNGLSRLDFGEREKGLLKSLGISLAFTGESGFFDRKTDPYEIPSLGVSGNRGGNKLWLTAKFLLAPVWDKLKADKEVRERVSIRKLWGMPAGSAESAKTQ